nr:reverse transcriptase domain-containing protein [Tanacetum cinerariifolium]
MQTRSSSRLVSNPSSNPTPSTNPNPKGRNRRCSKQRIEDFNLEDLSPPIVTMADQRTMAQLLQAPTEGYDDAIVVPAITADNFELKHGLFTLVQNKQFFRHDQEDPHAHVCYFNKITSTLKSLNVSNMSIKLMLFPFSLEGAARIWLEKEPPRSIFTWDDLVSKFINQFFPPSKTTNLRNEITNFQQHFDESFSEAWDRFKDLLRACPHHGFSKLHQLNTFYNALNSKDQDSLNSTAGGNFLDKMPRECLAIIEIKSKVRYSRNKPVVAKVSTNTSTSGISPDVAEVKDMVVEDKPEATKDTVNPTNNGNTKDVQPQVPNPKSLISYPSRRNDERNREKANNQIEKFYQIFKDMSFKIRFVDALILMPKFASTLKALIGNKEKLSEMARTPLNEHRSAIFIKKLPKKVGDTGKFLIPCDFPELANCSISHLVGVAEDVYVKVGSFHFSADFVVVDSDADPRVPLILKRLFSKTGRALIDVFEGELTLRVNKEDITFNLDQTSRYSANYSDMTAKRIDVIDMACEEYSQEVLEAFLNNDPSLPPPNQRNYMPEVRKELKIYEAKSDKSSVDEPLVVELKDLPPHIEYGFLESDDKLPVIIAKDLSVEERTALITVLKSHKKQLKSSKLATVDPQEVTMAQTTPPERAVGENHASWSDKLDDALWAFRTAYKTPIGCTPYKLVYRKACHLPVELEHKAYWSLKHANFDLKTAGDYRKVQINELIELRDQAYKNSLIYKEKTKRLHDSKIKNRVFNISDRVLFFNSRLDIFSRKLKSRWSGPFNISQVYPYGTVELSQPDKPNFKVNGHRLKDYFGEDVPNKKRIRLYCRGKENGKNILKFIDEGPFQTGTFQETISKGNEGALHLGPERPRVYSDFSPEEK